MSKEKLFIHKYTPKTLDDTIINKEIYKKAKNYISCGDILNTVIHGINGVGKYTLASSSNLLGALAVFNTFSA